jgi:hypothetical protein
MLNGKKLPNYFWVKTITTIVYQTPTTTIHGMTPKEKFISKKPNISHFRLFSCITCMHVHDEKRLKKNPKTNKCIFVEYYFKQKGYRCFNPSTQKLQVNRDVMFDEMASWYSP